MIDLIAKKRDGAALTRADLRFIVEGYAEDAIPDYQMSALLMAVYLRGMNVEETIELTAAMIDTGEIVEFPHIDRFTADKHSTGGVGDKTTLVLAPLLASLGVVVPKLSGRGLGHTGGTLDKLESIPGFRTSLSIQEFQDIANDAGVAVAAATQNLVPADKKIYALRDVTSTVGSTPLIASSIMSKKLAVHTDALVIDVKVGVGAFFPTREGAREFASFAAQIGKAFKRRVSFVLTDMSQPLGYAIGNALEVEEAISVLHGHGPEDLVTVCVALAGQIVRRDDESGTQADGRIRENLVNGKALNVFRTWIARQGGDARVADSPDRLPRARDRVTVTSPQSGVIRQIDARVIGDLAHRLGAGRTHKEDVIDPGAGIVLHAKVGARVRTGDLLAVLHSDRLPHQDWTSSFLQALEWSDEDFAQCSPVLETLID
ncbi:MAG: pyrimidine-nucleoside phosphorylase [Chloroflexota bacterium]